MAIDFGGKADSVQGIKLINIYVIDRDATQRSIYEYLESGEVDELYLIRLCKFYSDYTLILPTMFKNKLRLVALSGIAVIFYDDKRVKLFEEEVWKI